MFVYITWGKIYSTTSLHGKQTSVWFYIIYSTIGPSLKNHLQNDNKTLSKTLMKLTLQKQRISLAMIHNVSRCYNLPCIYIVEQIQSLYILYKYNSSQVSVEK